MGYGGLGEMGVGFVRLEIGFSWCLGFMDSRWDLSKWGFWDREFRIDGNLGFDGFFKI